MTAFYNEIDPYAAQWLENLIAAGHIAAGVVDRRPIQEIEARELAGFTQCHFFAGIGVWSHALRRAGWSDDTPVWTGSCPCQPFSSAGKQKGFKDARHLWPVWFNLIDQCRPARVLGEQVASKDGLGWLDLVSTDLEASDYAFGASDLCAAGFGQAHLRQRLYFVGLANSVQARRSERRAGAGERSITGCSSLVGLAHHHHPRLERRDGVPECRDQCAAGEGSLVDGLADANGEQADASNPKRLHTQSHCESNADAARTIRDPREIDQRWLDADWLLCRNPAGEPSWRPVESGTFPLAHGVAARMDQLRAYGNALDAETATGFAETVREILGV